MHLLVERFVLSLNLHRLLFLPPGFSFAVRLTPVPSSHKTFPPFSRVAFPFLPLSLCLFFSFSSSPLPLLLPQSHHFHLRQSSFHPLHPSPLRVLSRHRAPLPSCARQQKWATIVRSSFKSPPFGCVNFQSPGILTSHCVGALSVFTRCDADDSAIVGGHSSGRSPGLSRPFPTAPLGAPIFSWPRLLWQCKQIFVICLSFWTIMLYQFTPGAPREPAGRWARRVSDLAGGSIIDVVRGWLVNSSLCNARVQVGLQRDLRRKSRKDPKNSVTNKSSGLSALNWLHCYGLSPPLTETLALPRRT